MCLVDRYIEIFTEINHNMTAVKCNRSGPSCSKLTTSLVNDSLKFQMAILQIHYYFLLKKCENLFYQQKKYSVFAFINELRS